MDIANIYDLPEERIQQYRTNPFPQDEVRPGLQDFARKFKEELILLPTPYVLALEGGYGVGKTFFVTRFCEYLKNVNFDGDQSVRAVYLNLWENEYMGDPFSIIASSILSQFPEEGLRADVTQKAIGIVNSCFQFAAKVTANINIGNVLPNIYDNKKDIKTFKETFSRLLTDDGRKAVLIVDELDRCAPDYAVKTLEIIKHFFDIEGLIVILNTKTDFMDSLCDAHYGKPECNKSMGEGYIQKFVQSKKSLNPTTVQDYEFLISTELNIHTLPHDGRQDIMQHKIEQLRRTLAQNFYSNNLSIRKSLDACREIAMKIKRCSENIWRDDLIYGFTENVVLEYMRRQNIILRKDPPKIDWQGRPSNYEDQLIEKNVGELL